MPQILENVRAALAGRRRSLVVEVQGATLEASYEPLRDQDSVTGVVGVAHDISSRKRLEEQFLQSQKMEAVGQLAGGIAHDFNNILSAILGYAQLGLTKLSTESRVIAYLQEIQKSAERAAVLTHQLLAFSRHQVIQPEVFDLSELILNMHTMLRRLIGEDIDLVMVPDPKSGWVEMDRGQMEQVLVNLVINARDAMPGGGELLIEAANVALDDRSVELSGDATAGDYVMLLVRDSGTGMTEEVKAHIFEPFFTTKEPGKGTGLGLSTCYGIVTQSGGFIAFDSQSGRGTTMKIYLPRADQAPGHQPESEDDDDVLSGTETVFVVEDESAVRQVVCQVLREQGYTLLEAANGDDALKAARGRSVAQIDLLVTDVVMPLMGGIELSGKVREIFPDAAVLCMSGYIDRNNIDRDGLDPGTAY